MAPASIRSRTHVADCLVLRASRKRSHKKLKLPPLHLPNRPRRSPDAVLDAGGGGIPRVDGPAEPLFIPNAFDRFAVPMPSICTTMKPRSACACMPIALSPPAWKPNGQKLLGTKLSRAGPRRYFRARDISWWGRSRADARSGPSKSQGMPCTCAVCEDIPTFITEIKECARR